MLFKKKMPVREYCAKALKSVFEEGQEATWESLRKISTDDALISADAKSYYAHLTAVYVELMLIAVTKNSKMEISLEATHVMTKSLDNEGRSEVRKIAHDYSQAFASSATDGIMAMAMRFSECVGSGQMRQETIDQLYREFSAIFGVFYNDFRSIIETRAIE
jgi:hypothetical protein